MWRKAGEVEDVNSLGMKKDKDFMEKAWNIEKFFLYLSQKNDFILLLGMKNYKKIRLSVFAVLCLLSLQIGAQDAADGAIKNPVWGPDWADPTVWIGDDGQYYSVATGLRGVARSKDLFHWESTEIRPLSREQRQQIHQYGRNLWAPDVAVVNGKRLLYVTIYNSAEDSNIGVLKETEPGQFEFHGLITRGKETGIEDTIDPEVVTDPETGIVWLYFGSVGGIHRIQLSEDGLSLAPDARYEHVAGLTVHQNPSRSRVYEGSYLYNHEGYWYLFVSGGHYGDHTYKLRVGRSATLDGVFLDKEGQQMAEGYATTILSSEENDFFYGPGHCGEIYEKEGKTYLFYHCHNKGTENPRQRPMMLQEILWDEDGWPYFEGGKPKP